MAADFLLFKKINAHNQANPLNIDKLLDDILFYFKPKTICGSMSFKSFVHPLF